ncbi:MAG: hypothetical protein WDM71_06910 [Ferruginibacter sp.]
MKVDETKTVIIDSEHSIEIGGASWDENELTIRRRKDLNGRFDVHSSSEIPISGHLNISHLLIECLKNDLISPSAMTNILNEVIDSSKRQNSKIVII